MYEAKLCNWIIPCGKKLHSLTVAEHSWRPNSVCKHREVEGSVFQQWLQRCERQAMLTVTVKFWVTSTDADLYECSMQAPIHNWQQCVVHGDNCVKKKKKVICSWKLTLSNSIIVPFVSVLAFTEITGRHYFWSDQHVHSTSFPTVYLPNPSFKKPQPSLPILSIVVL